MAKDLRLNEQIRVPQVRVIRGDEQLGIMDTREAQRLADEAELDLVEIAPTAQPPVVKIMDFGKFKYEQAKKERESRRGSKQVELREVRMKVKIDTHDRDFKIRTARKLLLEGDKVKMSVMLRARENSHPEVAEELLKKILVHLEDIADVERPPRLEGRFMSMTLDPAKKAAARKVAESKQQKADNAAPVESEVEPVAAE
ncbi:MAG: translation initiation factor IF-3 [Chloroflexi bacterium]|nr:translation initiation factor IF-3 [Chloroflexota bacterium]